MFVRFDETGNIADLSDSKEYTILEGSDDWMETDLEWDFDTQTLILDNGNIKVIDLEIDPEEEEEVEEDGGSTFIDEEGRTLTEQIYFEGGGINSSRAGGWTRRFNGMTMSNRTGLMWDKGAVIECLEFSCYGVVPKRTVEFYHYDVDGRNGVRVFSHEVPYESEEKGRFLSKENLKLFIPPRRRFAVYLRGGVFSYPQYRIGYRRVL